MGIVGSGHAGVIALEDCDGRAGGAVPRNRTAEFGRLRSSGTGVAEPDPDAPFVANAIVRSERSGSEASREGGKR
jgi:hypothetical protein